MGNLKTLEDISLRVRLSCQRLHRELLWKSRGVGLKVSYPGDDFTESFPTPSATTSKDIAAVGSTFDDR